MLCQPSINAKGPTVGYAVHLQLETVPIHLGAQFCQKVLVGTETQACRLGAPADSQLDNKILQHSQCLGVTSRVFVGRPVRAIAPSAYCVLLPGPFVSLDHSPVGALLSVACHCSLPPQLQCLH